MHRRTEPGRSPCERGVPPPPEPPGQSPPKLPIAGGPWLPQAKSVKVYVKHEPVFNRQNIPVNREELLHAAIRDCAKPILAHPLPCTVHDSDAITPHHLFSNTVLMQSSISHQHCSPFIKIAARKGITTPLQDKRSVPQKHFSQQRGIRKLSPILSHSKGVPLSVRHMSCQHHGLWLRHV